MYTTVTTKSGKQYEIDLYFSNVFKGRGGWNINLKANWQGEKYESHIYTTNTRFIDELSDRKAEDESWDTIQQFYADEFLHLFETDLSQWCEELENQFIEK